MPVAPPGYARTECEPFEHGEEGEGRELLRARLALLPGENVDHGGERQDAGKVRVDIRQSVHLQPCTTAGDYDTRGQKCVHLEFNAIRFLSCPLM